MSENHHTVLPALDDGPDLLGVEVHGVGVQGLGVGGEEAQAEHQQGPGQGGHTSGQEGGEVATKLGRGYGIRLYLNPALLRSTILRK